MGGPSLLPGQQLPPQPEPLQLTPAPADPPPADPPPTDEGAGNITQNAPPKPFDGATQQQNDATEQAARAQGWVPENEWRGDPAAWRPAATFLEMGPHAARPRSELVERSARLDQIEAQVGSLMKLANSQFQAGIDAGIERERERMHAAVENGDHEEVAAAQREMSRLEAQKSEAAETAGAHDQRTAEAAQAAAHRFNIAPENRWLHENVKARALFDHYLRQHTPVRDGVPVVDNHDAHLASIREMVRRDMPEAFGENVQRQQPGPGALTGGQPGAVQPTLQVNQNTGPTWQQLPCGRAPGGPALYRPGRVWRCQRVGGENGSGAAALCCRVRAKRRSTAMSKVREVVLRRLDEAEALKGRAMRWVAARKVAAQEAKGWAVRKGVKCKRAVDMVLMDGPVSG